ncbi:MAG: YggS family pyridoxal phosphate-dependent enzyme [Spirochaetaceae bacterium]|jgi:pyridoxal phosphate enzyme (YggS family)|nr:YggS family pyridoxal phosphate-dependent enzyme [Spirochaetaceae bacterium]
MSILDNIKRIEDEINDVSVRIGRDRKEIELMAVSKFHPRSAVETARKAGLRLFGESRVKEALLKFEDYKTAMPDTELHFIGGLQRNKAKAAVVFFDCIESVDRDELIEELGALSAGRENPLPLLLELNSGEDSKSGYRELSSLLAACEKVLERKGLLLAGLMTLAPLSDDEKKVRAAFRALASAQKTLKAHFPECPLSILSMGMSGDFKIAIEEGSTLIRIGTAIFGERILP